MEIHQENIWITGASSGIGQALSLRLAANNRVFVSARNETALNELSRRAPGIVPIPCDVSDVESVALACQVIAEKVGHLNRVIISAGTCEYLDIAAPDWNMMQRVMAVNYFGAVNTVQYALPLLRKTERGRAHIVAIASLASVVPFPRAEAYGASKAAVSYFFDALGIDLAREKIAVTVVQPGFVDTPLTKGNDFPMPALMSADAAATRILKKIARKPRRLHFPLRLALSLKLFALLPGLWWLVATKSLSRNS